MASLEDLTPEIRDELAKLARDLSENPETRREFLKLTKKARPNIPVPEIEISDKADKTLEEARETVRKLEEKLSEKDATDELRKRRHRLIENGKAADDKEVEEIEKIMLERGIQNHETAGDYYQWMKQAAKPGPAPYNPLVLDKDTRSRITPYMKNPVNAAREEAANALRDIRQGKIKLVG